MQFPVDQAHNPTAGNTAAAPTDQRSVRCRTRRLAVSPQKPDQSLSMQEKHALGYAVLSDPGNVLAGAVGIVTAPSAEVHDAQLQLGLDLTAGNADGTVACPMATPGRCAGCTPSERIGSSHRRDKAVESRVSWVCTGCRRDRLGLS